MVYLIIFLVIIFIIYLAVHNKNKQTEEQNEQNIKEIKNRFYNNENVTSWAKEIADFIEKNLEKDSSIYKEFHIRVCFDCLIFGDDLLQKHITNYDIILKFYFSKFNLPNLDYPSMWWLSVEFPKIILSYIDEHTKQLLKTHEPQVITDNNDEYYVSGIIYEPNITGKW